MRAFDGAPFADKAVDGLAAIVEKEYRDRVAIVGPRPGRVSVASVDIDAAMREAWPQAPRWDYGVWYGASRPQVAFIEPHKARSEEVDLVIRKQRWLKDLLAGTAMPTPRWYWLASGRVLIPRGSSYYRRLIQAGISLEARSITLE